MPYHFDKIISRRHTNAISVEGFREYLLGRQKDAVLPYPDDELINMWVADMEFATAPEIISALKKRVDHGIFGYTQVFDAAYYEAFGAWVKSKYDWEVDKSHIVTAHGVVPALYDLIPYCCQPDEKVLILTPSYGYFKHAAVYNGIELVTSPLMCENGHYALDFEDIEVKLKDEKLTLFILCSPHNPSGRIWTAAELQRLGDLCLQHDVTIISDEIHCDLVRKGNVFTPLAKLFPGSDQIITCMSPSKTFNLAGLMLANIIIPNEALRAKWHKKHFGMDNPLSIVAAQAAYTQGHAWLSALTDYLDRNFEFVDQFLKKELPGARFVVPQATYLAWIDLSAYFPPSENLTLFFAQKAGVLLEGGNMFVSNAEGYVRINLACPKSRLEQGMEWMAKAIQNK